MRVDIDARMLRSGGIGRYIREIVGPWLTSNQLSAVRLYGNVTALESWLARIEARGTVDVEPWDDPVYSAAAQVHWLTSRFRGRAWRPDVTFFPHFTAPLVGHPKPSVVVIHDLIHLRVPGAFPVWKRALAAGLIRRVGSMTDRIVTVSQTSREHILDFLGDAEAPVDVIRTGVSEIFTPGGRVVSESAPFVLVVAPHKPHKNVALAVQILRHLPKRDGWRLIAVGPDIEDRRAMASATEVVGLDRRIDVPGPRTDTQLRDLYREAAVVVVPSLLEGFALPALEARACGARVLAPDLPWARELLHAGVELVSGWDPREWAQIVREVPTRAGSEVDSDVSMPRWSAASEATLSLLEGVAKNGPLG